MKLSKQVGVWKAFALQGMLPRVDREECWVSTVGNIGKVLSIMLTPCSCFFDH